MRDQSFLARNALDNDIPLFILIGKKQQRDNSFAEGLYAMSQKGIFGERINLTKKRAWVLRDMIKRL